MKKIGIIIQARMGSIRLPGKVLLPIAGHPLLKHVFGRLKNLKAKADIIVATSHEERDDSIVKFCIINNVNCYRGSERDVLARYYECSKKYSFIHIVRLTADNPFTDIDELDRLIELHIGDCNDYTHSFGDLPVGVGAEIFSYNALERSFIEGKSPNHREHVNEYIQENPSMFKIGQLTIPKEKTCSELRLTVDTEEDYQKVCHVAEHAVSDWVTTAEAIDLCLHSV